MMELCRGIKSGKFVFSLSLIIILLIELNDNVRDGNVGFTAVDQLWNGYILPM